MRSRLLVEWIGTRLPQTPSVASVHFCVHVVGEVGTIRPGRAKNKLDAHAVAEAEKHSDNKRREIKKERETLLPDGLCFFFDLFRFIVRLCRFVSPVSRPALVSTGRVAK